MAGSTADSPAPPADIAGTKLKTRLLKESDVVEGGSPRKFYAWNKLANDGAGGLVFWDVDTPSGRLQPRGAHTRPDGTWCTRARPKRAICRLFRTNELIDAGIDLDMRESHEVTLLDGTKHTAKPVWAYLEESVADCTSEWCQEITGLDPTLVEEGVPCVGDAPEGQTYGNGGSHLNLAPDQIGNCTQTVRSVIHLMYMDRQLGRPRRQPRPHALSPGRAGHVGARFQHAAGSEGPACCFGRDSVEGVEPDPTNLPDKIETLSNMVGAEEFPLTAYYNEWADAQQSGKRASMATRTR